MIAIISVIGGGGVGQSSGDWVVAALIIMSGLGAASGYRVGALAVSALIVGGVAALKLAPGYARLVEPLLASQFGLSGLMNRGASLLVAGAGVSLAALAIGCAMRACFISPGGRANRADRLLGAVFGAAEGLAIATLVLCSALFLEPFARQQLAFSGQVSTTEVAVPYVRAGFPRPASAGQDASSPAYAGNAARPQGVGNVVSRAIVAIAEGTAHSRVAPWTQKYDPLQHSSWGRTMKDAVTVVGNPEAMERFLEHEAFAELKDKPELQAAATHIANDEEVRRILQKHGGVNQNSLGELLASPRFLQLIDETGVTKQLAGLATHLQPALGEVADEVR